jgi:O-antigen ligase
MVLSQAEALRRPRGPMAVAAAALVAATIAGLAIAVDPKIGLGLVLGLCLTGLAILNFPLALVLCVPLPFLTLLPLGGAQRAAEIVIVVAWLGALMARRSTQRALLGTHRSIILLLVATLTWVTLSSAWARDSTLAWHSLSNWYQAAIVLVILVTTLGSERFARLALWGFVVGGALAVVSGLVLHPVIATSVATPSPNGEPARFSGASGDPNFLAAGLVGALAFAVALALSVRTGRRLWLLVLTVPIVAGFAATESRGGLIAALVMIAAWLVFAGERRRHMVAVLLVASVLAGAWLVAHPAEGQRFTSFGSGSTGRTTIWTVATRMWMDHPFTGVGVGNFMANSPRYIERPGQLTYIEFIVTDQKVVHNMFLELLAETGIVGALLYFATAGACLRAAWKAARLFERRGRSDMAAIAYGVLIAAVSMLAAFFFLSGETDLRLWVVLALGPVLHAIASSGLRPSSGPKHVRGRRPPPALRAELAHGPA